MNQIAKVLFVTGIALLMPIIPFFIVGELPGERWLSATDDNALLFACAGSGLLLVDVLLPVPSSIVITLMGSRLGFIEAWFSAWVGLTAGNLLGYGIGRLWPDRWAPSVPEEPTLMVLLISRPVPVLAEAMAIASGAARSPLIHVLLVCGIGNVVYTGVLTANGAALLTGDVTGLGVFLMLLLPSAAWAGWRLTRWKSQRGDSSAR